MTRIDEIRERASAATEGPWVQMLVDVSRDVVILQRVDENHAKEPVLAMVSNQGIEQHIAEANASLISHARADIPWLLDEIARLRAEREFISGLLDDAKQRAEAAEAVVETIKAELDVYTPVPVLEALEAFNKETET